MALSQLVEVQGLANNERGSGGGNIAMFALQAGLKQVGVPPELDGLSYCRKPISLSACIGREQLLCPTVLLLAVAAIAASRGSNRISKKAASCVCQAHLEGAAGFGFGFGAGLGRTRLSTVSSWHWGCPPQHQLLGQPAAAALGGDQEGIPFFLFPPSFSFN